MSRQSWVEVVKNVVADATAIANSVTETILFPNITIPADYLEGRRALRLKFLAKHSTTGTPTLTFELRWGGVAGTVLCKTGAITCGSGVTNALIEGEIILHVRSDGASGAVLAGGHVTVHGGTAPTVGSATGAPAIAPMTNGGQTVPAAATVDLTADTALSLTAQWGTQSSSNTITGQMEILESLN